MIWNQYLPRPKGLNVLGIVFSLLLLSACTGTITPQPILDTIGETIPVSVSLTPIPSPINALHKTPSPSATFSVKVNTPTLTELNWTIRISPLFFPDDNLVENLVTWSPTANEILFRDCEGDKTNISIAAAPDFQIETLSNQSACSDASWSLDGQFVAFIDSDNNIRVASRDGSESPRINQSEALRYPTIQGWIDTEHLIYGSYSGGGHESFSVVNIHGNQEQRIATVPGSAEIIHAGYIPITFEPDPLIYRLLVISDQLPISETPIDMFIADGRYLQFPNFLTVPVTQTSTVFQGWLPETNQILVAWTAFSLPPEREIQKEHLVLWDVTADAVTLLAPNGIRGLISPDGTYLAYITRGQAQLSQDGTVVNDDSGYHRGVYDPSLETIEYMQVLRMADKKVILSIPAQEMNFSPDSRHLAFTNTSTLQLNSSRWPVDLVQEGEKNDFIHILDLAAGTLSISIEGASGLPVWAPDSERFLYQDTLENLLLGNLLDAKASVIANNAGTSVIRGMDWSYDGQYFSVRITNEEDHHYVALVKAP